MSINPLNDISKVYLEQVVESSHLETDMKKRAEANEKARKEMMKTKAHKDMVAAARKKFDEAMDPVGQEDADIDNDGDTDKSDKYLHKRRKAIGNAISKRKGVKEAKGYYDPMEDPDFDPREAEKTRGVSGKNNPKGGKSLGKKKSVKEGFSNWRQDLSEVMTDIGDNKKIKEKKINNKVKINPNIGEAVENIGGTLLEMVEVDEVDYIIESAYDELLDEGFTEDEVEEALEYALIEAKVTFGHDTPTEKKRSGLLAAARQKLASKVGGAKAAVKKAVASGARKVAKGALGVARKMEAGDKKPSTAHTKTRSSSTYRGAGVGTKERVSSGSYQAPQKKKTETVSDPWEGSYKKSSEVKAKTKKASAPKAKAPSRKKKSKLDDLLASVRSESAQIDEKTLTKMEMKKREEIVKSMKDKASDFEKRYPGRGKEVMYATATKMAKKMAEQAMDLQPKTQPEPKEKPLDTAIERQKYTNLKMMQQKQQQLQKQKLNLQKQGKLPLETESFEVIDERRKAEKGTPRKPRDPAFELVAKSMGAGRMGVQPRGQKKEPGKKPPAAGEYGGPLSPAQKVQKRRDAAQRAQDMMHSRFD